MLQLPLIAATISAFGQVLLKYAMIKHGAIDFSLPGLFRLLTEPRLILALSIYAAALLMWLHVLSKVPLSTAYPMLAITYAIVPLLSMAFFGERIQQPQMIGICLVLAGVTLIGKTG
jgi:multidrug transporter EmrE-like cation transporter